LSVDNNGFNSATIKSSLANNFHVFAALADINGHGDYFFTGGVFEPTDPNRGI
jgi:hypothetical protein